MFHISNIGRLIEANEDALRMTVQDSYVNKQRQITNTGRLVEEYMTDRERVNFQEMARTGQLLGDNARSSANDEVHK